MAINAIKYAIETQQLFEAQRILDQITACNSLCNDVNNKNNYKYIVDNSSLNTGNEEDCKAFSNKYTMLIKGGNTVTINKNYTYIDKGAFVLNQNNVVITDGIKAVIKNNINKIFSNVN